MPTVIERQKEMSDLSKRERLKELWGRPMFWVVTKLLNQVSDEKTYRYDLDNNRISVSGVSETPGDVAGHNRGVGLMAATGVMLSMMFTMLIIVPMQSWGPPSGMLDAGVRLFLLACATGCILMASATASTALACEVVDHTTEPLPDDLDDLKQQFVDGDLDDSEFEAQLEDRLTEVEAV